MNPLMLAHEVMCAALIFTVFCRFVRTDAETSADVRAAFWVLGTVACAGIPAPLVWGFVPTGWTVAMLASILLVQAVTATHWHNGAPSEFKCNKER